MGGEKFVGEENFAGGENIGAGENFAVLGVNHEIKFLNFFLLINLYNLY